MENIPSPVPRYDTSCVGQACWVGLPGSHPPPPLQSLLLDHSENRVAPNEKYLQSPMTNYLRVTNWDSLANKAKR